MVRRNLFQPPPFSSETEASGGTTRFPNTGAMSGVRATLRDMSNNAVRDLDPAMIEDSGSRDRLAFGADEVAALAESIRTHGQQVPIMVRPLPERPGRYQIVYGRRRLAALRLLGMPARAMVRLLDDQQAILAQGQENSLRLDPSFIEKALFVSELAEQGHAPSVILDALAIDKPMLSRMQKVARSLPRALIEKIGPAHGIGRRRWEEMVELSRTAELDLEALCAELPESLSDMPSDARFAHVLADVARLSAHFDDPATGPAQIITPDGRPLAELNAGARSLSLKFDTRSNPEFSAWLQANAEGLVHKLYQSWTESQDSVETTKRKEKA